MLLVLAANTWQVNILSDCSIPNVRKISDQCTFNFYLCNCLLRKLQTLLDCFNVTVYVIVALNVFVFLIKAGV